MSPRCVVPLLPSVTVMFVKPLMFRTKPELMTIRLRKNEVEFFNEVVQIYSRDHIFFRNDKPRIIDGFSKREHLQFEYHQHEWLDNLIAGAVNFTPERDSNRRACGGA